MNVLGKWDYGQSNNHPVLKRENQDKNWIKKKKERQKERQRVRRVLSGDGQWWTSNFCNGDPPGMPGWSCKSMLHSVRVTQTHGLHCIPCLSFFLVSIR